MSLLESLRDPWRSPPQAVLEIAAGALLAAAATAFVATVAEVASNGYLAAGFHHLPLFVFADRLWDLLIPATVLRLLISLGLELAVRWRPLGNAARILSVVVSFGTAGLLVRFQDAVVAWLVSYDVLGLGRWLALERLRWTLQPKVLLLLLLILCAATVAGRAIPAAWSRFVRRGTIVAAIVAICLPAAAGLDRIALRSARDHPGEDRKNVVLIVLDTVGAGHLASYGYRRATMPEVDRLGERGVRFTRAYSVAPWTLPSHASMFTGLHPIVHRTTQESLRLSRELPTLAEILRDRGFDTFAAVGNGILGSYNHFDQGFTTYLPTWRRDVETAYRRPGVHPNNAALSRFLDAHGAGPFFVFVNYIEAHGPYAPPAPFTARYLPPGVDAEKALAIDQRWQRYYTGKNALTESDFAVLRDLYDAELSSLSRSVGALVEDLEGRGLLDETLVIVTSDHGENLGEHGHLDHVFSLHDTLLHVPLIVLGAGVRPAIDDRPVSSVDVFDTVLAAAGAADRASGQGHDLLAPAPPVTSDEQVAEYYFPSQALAAIEPGLRASSVDRLAPYFRRLRSLRSGGWKLIWGSDGRHELYRIAEDPEELVDLASLQPERVDELRQRLERRLGELKGEPVRLDGDEPLPLEVSGFEGLDEETMERLKTLGYVD